MIARVRGAVFVLYHLLRQASRDAAVTSAPRRSDASTVAED